MDAVGTSRRSVTRVLTSGAVTTALSVPLTFILIPFTIHNLDLSRFGEWATLAAVLSIAQLAEAGVPTEVARRVAVAHGAGDAAGERRAVREAVTLMLYAGGGLLLVALVLQGPIIHLVFPEADAGRQELLRHVLLATTATLAVSLVLAAWFAALGGLQRHDFGAYSGLLGAVVAAVVTVVGVRAGLDIWALFLAALARSLVGWAGPLRGLLTLRPDITPRPVRVSAREARNFLGTSSLLTMAAIANIADYQVDKTVLTHFRGAAAAGNFQVASNLALQARAVALLPAGILLAGAAELFASRSESLQRLRRLTTSATSCLAVVVLGAAILFAGPFIQLWLGPNYSDAARATRGLSLSLLVGAVTATWYYYALGRKKYRVITYSALVSLIVNALGTVLLTPHYGLSGAIAGSLSAAGLSVIVMYALLRRSGEVLELGPMLKPVAVGVVIGAVFVVLGFVSVHSYPTLILAGLAWSLVCGGVMVVLGLAPLHVERSSTWRVSVKLAL